MDKGWKFGRGTAAAALVLAACAGCADLQGRRHPEVSGAGNRIAREAEMNQRWQNRRMSELLAVMGQPVLVMNIPGGGNPPGFALVYAPDSASGCIDAFAMLHEQDPRIRVYYCR